MKSVEKFEKQNLGGINGSPAGELERRLRASQAWLSTILNGSGDGLIAANLSGTVVFLNAAAERLTGYTTVEAEGRPVREILELREEGSGGLKQESLPPAGESRTYILCSKNGNRTPVEIARLENRSEPEVPGAILVIRDLGAKRDLEARLIESQRMEAIARVAGVLAHDFNNQLTVILGYADELCQRLVGPEREAALDIRQSASIAGSLTSQLLTLSRKDAVRREVLNLNETIFEMRRLLSHSLGKERALLLELRSPAGFVRADRNELKQVLLNLVLNARDAMPEGGEIRIETSVIETVTEGRQGPAVRLRVSDSGTGMDRSTLARIFEPYFTTKKAGAGTGLGLAIVQAIITQTGGRISVTSELGKGTTFEILLPCCNASQNAPDTAGEAEPSVRRMSRQLPVANEGLSVVV